MITVKNIIEEYPKIGISLPAHLSNEKFAKIKDMIDLYGEDEKIDEYIDKFIELLNKELSASSSKKKSVNKKAVAKFPKRKTAKPAKSVKPKKAAKSAPAKPAKAKTVKTPKTPKAPKAPKAPATPANVKYVEDIDIEVSLIKSFALLHNKTKTVPQLTTLLRKINKAILQKKIRANSVFADDIKNMQKKLEKLIEKLKGANANAKIEIDDVEKFREIGNSEKLLKSVTFIIRYMNLVNKPDIDAKAARLLSEIKNAEGKGTLDNKYSDLISFVKTNLSKYDRHDMLPIPEPDLQGLTGHAGLGFVPQVVSMVVAGLLTNEIYDRKRRAETVTADKLAKMEFDTIEMPAEYRGLIGKAERGGSVMIYGDPGSGKSSLAVKMAKGFANAGKKVLYVTKEEGVNATMKEKLIRYGATSPNITIAENIPANMDDYYAVIFDSVQTLRLVPDDIMKHKRFNNHIRLYVFQVTKDGKFRGGEDFAHNVDCVLYAENGTITSFGQKNRFGGRGSVKVY